MIRAAYRPASDIEEWLAEVLRAVTPHLDQGLGVHVTRLEGRAQVAAIFTDPLVATSKELQRRRKRSGAVVAKAHHALGFEDSLGLLVLESRTAGLLIAAPAQQEIRMGEALRMRWSHIAAHLSSGLRLHRQAQSEHAYAALRDAAMAIDRAGRLRHGETPEEALALWRALVDGRWSLIDHFDSDGRHYYLAQRNDPQASGHRGLSLREQQVCSYASMGHSNKLIAYELGLSPTTVATHLASALRKLGYRSRLALIRDSR